VPESGHPSPDLNKVKAFVGNARINTATNVGGVFVSRN
jgi:hypothetical protein